MAITKSEPDVVAQLVVQLEEILDGAEPLEVEEVVRTLALAMLIVLRDPEEQKLRGHHIMHSGRCIFCRLSDRDIFATGLGINNSICSGGI